MRRLVSIFAAAAAIAATLSAAPAGQATELHPPGVCDPIDPSLCMLPFPNDFFTRADASSETGRRVNISTFAMPRNTAGKPVDPTEWNRNDGFSPVSPVVTYVPGLDLHKTWGSDTDHITDIARYTATDAPILIINTETGERHPFWSETDTAAARPYETGADKRALILRPADNFEEGVRYVVALRNLRDADGELLEPGRAFKAIRDGRRIHDPNLRRRARHLEADVFGVLGDAGVARDDLYLAWDFTVISAKNLTGRMVAIRDDAFASLGDDSMDDGEMQGDAPAFTVEKIIPNPTSRVARTVRGNISVPNYLLGGQTVEVATPGALGNNPAADQSVPVGVPGARFNYGHAGPFGDNLPQRNPLRPSIDVPYECHIPNSASSANPSPVFYYGHGLIGSKSQSRGSATDAMFELNSTYCAVDWMGMALGDLPNIATVMLDTSNFPSFADRIQQGFLNQLFLGRAFGHPQGFASNPAFGDSGGPVIRTGDVYYDGNSQGGILGGPVVALSPDIERGNLGVTGAPYSTLLNRSVDWEGLYGEPFYPNYRDKLQQQLMFSLMQQLWDRAEGSGYAHHIQDGPSGPLGVPAHAVMLQLAFGDHQVANIAGEVEARMVGAAIKTPALPDAAHWSSDIGFGFEEVTFDNDGVLRTSGGDKWTESVLMYWFDANANTGTPPNGNVPSEGGSDPHSSPRRDRNASAQKLEWLLNGNWIDTCGGGPCITTPANRV